MRAWEQLGIGAGAILLAALVVGIIQALLALRDNTKAVKQLTKGVEDLKTETAGALTQVITRVDTLEKWRIAIDARAHHNAD